jgi:predicted transposase YbfD/YdcC
MPNHPDSPPLSFAGIQAAFADLPDPRRDHLKEYGLPDIMVLVVSGMLAACENWVEIADFGAARADWFAKQGLFPKGMPSHDTLGRVFRVLDAQVMRTCFARWVQSAIGELRGVVAIDGKTSRATCDGADRPAIHTVSAYATESGLTLAHTAVAEKSNEITAIPVLLDTLALKDCTVTIDAMGCQKDIAEHICRRGGDYLLQVKANQPATARSVSDFFTDADQRGWRGTSHTTAKTHEHGHGRSETREAWACPVHGPWIAQHGWKNLRQIVRIRRSRTIGDTTTTEDHFYISSETVDAARILHMARQHWGIEAKTHWILDVVFNEDRCRARKDHAAHNLVTIRRFVLNLLRRNPKAMGLRRRRKIASYNMHALTELLALATVSPAG